MTKSRFGLIGINPKLVIDIYPINPFTALQQFKKLPDPLIFTSKR